jgi:hypothetical protein
MNGEQWDFQINEKKISDENLRLFLQYSTCGHDFLCTRIRVISVTLQTFK